MASEDRRLSAVTNASDDEVHTGTAWASHVDDPWDPSILTLDGGGIRGYSSLLILQQLMHEIAGWEQTLEEEGRAFNEDELLPCHYFDFMYGTSTGGLIATMLGRLRMTVPQCLELYREVGNDLFGHTRSIIPLTTKYHHVPLEKAVQRIVQKHCPTHPMGTCDGLDWHPWKLDEEDDGFDVESSERICQSICLTATHNGRIDEAYLLRTYNHRYGDIPKTNWITLYNEGADPLRIWQAARATSAAPFYFKALEASIRNEAKVFKDGGIRENNPAGAAWNEFVSLYGEDKDPALLLSIGTGRPDESQDGFATAWPGPFGNSRLVKKAAEKFAVFRNVLIKYTEGEEKHRAMVSVARGEFRWYKRLNVSSGLEKMNLDNWEKGVWRDPAIGKEKVVSGGRTLTRMTEATQAYLMRDYDGKFDTYAPPKVMLKQAAEKLVRQRRARERTAGLGVHQKRWESFMGKWLTGQDLDGTNEVATATTPP